MYTHQSGSQHKSTATPFTSMLRFGHGWTCLMIMHEYSKTAQYHPNSPLDFLHSEKAKACGHDYKNPGWMPSNASPSLALRCCLVPFFSDVPCLMHETMKQKAQIVRFFALGSRGGISQEAPLPCSSRSPVCLAWTLCLLETHVPRAVVPHSLRHCMQWSSSLSC